MKKRTLGEIISSTAKDEGIGFNEAASKAFDAARIDRSFSLRLADAAVDTIPLTVIFNLAKLASPDED